MAAEMIIFGLRTAEGIDLDAIRGSTRVSGGHIKKLFAVLQRLSESDLVLLKNERWILTPRGRDLADHVAVELL